jgi:hypothetical protein
MSLLRASHSPHYFFHMGSMIFQVLAFFTLISVVCAADSLYFTNVPGDAWVGQQYSIDWTGGDYSTV